MVSLNGAIQAQPYIPVIEGLQAAVAALTAALATNPVLWQVTFRVYTSDTPQTNTAGQLPTGPQTNQTVQVTYSFSAADSVALLNDLKNILANDINIETNALGAIS